MNRVVRTPQADLDVFEIALYIAEDNIEASDRFIDTLDNKLELLSRSPSIGRSRGELAAGLRSFPFKKYVIFYRPIRGGIEVVRVLHASRDIPSLFSARAV